MSEVTTGDGADGASDGRSAARRTWSILLGAAFLMATSAIGPGFLTQTTVFTERLGASFGFAILVSIVVDLVAQLAIWRVIAVTGRRAQDVANRVLPGLGLALVVLVSLGGFAFNIGNVAGAGLGIEAALGVPTSIGAPVSAAIAVVLFLVKEAGRAMDRFAQALGVLMVGLTLYVAIASHPPVGEAIVRTVAPTAIDVVAIVTIVGGTVGGYITFAGGHRLLDAGISGRDALPRVSRAAASGIGIASLMRVLLFLAALGIVSQGGPPLDPGNPPAAVFQRATGELGLRLFGLVMWSAAITSVVGAAYTSVSFLRTLHPWIERNWRAVIVAFIAASALVFAIVGRPVRTLIVVGALNGLILPLSLGAMLAAARRGDIVGDWRLPAFLWWAGVLTASAMAAMGAWTLVTQLLPLAGA